MRHANRREFLASLSCSLLATSALPVGASGETCWLDVCAPYIVEDSNRGISTEIILTADTFSGINGHEDSKNATEYQLSLYDSSGKAIGSDQITRRVTVEPLHTTVIPVKDLINGHKTFWGGMKIRLRPRSGMHASDLFSSAFVRWRSKESFDNVHANPDPLQWQNTQSYYYSMPFPSLDEYDCTFSLFNPNEQASSGVIALKDAQGKVIHEQRYELRGYASLLINLNSAGLINDPWTRATVRRLQCSGLLSVVNREGTAKAFGYLMIRSHERERFSVEHPIHQGIVESRPAPEPFDSEGRFKARNVLYTPLLFREHRVGNLTLNSRCYVGSGLPHEDAVWIYPFATDESGEAVWSIKEDRLLKSSSVPGKLPHGVARISTGQSYILDFAKASLKRKFAGALGIAVAPDTSHTLMKLEVRIPEWGAHAFTHFRPGLRSARAYQKPRERGGLASDYIVSGAGLLVVGGVVERDELIGVVNIDDQALEANPQLELFGPDGFVQRVALGKVAPFACRHYLLSELVGRAAKQPELTLRLVDERATLLMSAVHLDYSRRELALDHGSDRFSTFSDYDCS